MAKFEPFVLERMVSKWENVVEINLSESGVYTLKLGELIALAGRTVDELANVEINYPQATAPSACGATSRRSIPAPPKTTCW